MASVLSTILAPFRSFLPQSEPVVVDRITKERLRVVSCETSEDFNSLAPLPNIHPDEITLSIAKKLGLRSGLSVDQTLECIYAGEQNYDILVKYNNFEYTTVTSKNFGPRIDSLIDILSYLDGSVIKNVIAGLKALKAMSFETVSANSSIRTYAFDLVLEKDNCYTFFVFNYRCHNETFILNIPLLGLNSHKTNYAHCLVKFSAVGDSWKTNGQ